MKKKGLVLLAALLMGIVLTACGGGTGLEGKWKLTGAEGADSSELAEFEQYGSIYFHIKGGKMTIDLETGPNLTSQQKMALQMLEPMLTSADIRYEVLSDTEMKLTITAFDQTDEATVEYHVDGDTLVLYGATFTRQ